MGLDAVLGTIISGLVSLIVTALWRGWVIPRPTMNRERELQDKINAMREREAEVSRELAEKARADAQRLAEQLADAHRQRAAVPAIGS